MIQDKIHPSSGMYENDPYGAPASIAIADIIAGAIIKKTGFNS